jgi:hypothetical protein
MLFERYAGLLEAQFSRKLDEVCRGKAVLFNLILTVVLTGCIQR